MRIRTLRCNAAQHGCSMDLDPAAEIYAALR
jgi:hypothetical protein